MNYHDNEMYNSQNLSKYMNLILVAWGVNLLQLLYPDRHIEKIPEDIAKMQNSIDKDCSNIFVRI